MSAQDIKPEEEYIHRANNFIMRGQSGEAIKIYDEAIKLNPKSSKLYYERGCAWFGNRLTVNMAKIKGPQDLLAATKYSVN